jgi:LacI family gluconate utilization system Gnt-I transcriptional repressor
MKEESPERPPTGRSPGALSVTLRDVARRAGVSTMTVSRAIHAPDRVSPALRERVDEAVRVLGYVPNLMANGLRSSRSHLVTALVPTISGSLFSDMIRSLTEALEAQGFQLMVGQIGYGRSREDDLLRAIIGRRPDGIVLTGILHSEEGRSMLIASGIPVVETWDTTRTPIDMLLSLSHEQIGRRVCEYLHARGKRRLALLSGRDERAERRGRGFLQAAADLGLDAPAVRWAGSPTTHREGREGLAAVIGGGDAVDGVFCSSDMMAAGVLTEARARGIAVPERLAVVGFGDLDFAASLVPALTTVRIDGGAIGAMAARMIAARADGLLPPQRIVEVEFSIVERGSA